METTITSKNRSGIKTHLSLGIFYCTLIAIVQGFAEAFVLSISHIDYFFGPQNLVKSHIFSFINGVSRFDGASLNSFILDKYLGPNFINKIPLVYNLITFYAIVGLVGGICLGVFLWIIFGFVKRYPDTRKLNLFYLTFVLSLGVLINLILFLKSANVIKVSNVLTGLVILSIGVFLGVLIYKLLMRKEPIQGYDRISNPSQVVIRRGWMAFLTVVAMAIMAVVLNKWVFYDTGTEEILAAQNNQNAGKGLARRNNGHVSIILISVDSLRADHLSSYGYHRETSSNIDRLASEGIMFSRAFSSTSWTLPSHISMLTSMYSKTHGVMTGSDYLDENRLTLAEVLKDNGYATAAFVSGPNLHSVYGFDQGFDLYDDFTIDYNSAKDSEQNTTLDKGSTKKLIPFSAHVESRTVVTSPRLTKAIRSWLGENYQKKFFLFLHYWDVHYDYIPPPPYDTMFDPDYKGSIDARDFSSNTRINPEMDPRDLEHIIALYDGEIAFTDKYIGELLSTLKRLGIYDNTLIVFTADHGDEFFEHGNKGHQRSLYDEVLQVPLIFKFPINHNFEAKRLEEVVSILDIMPTIMDYLEIRPHEEIQGRSLLPLLNGVKPSNESLIYARLRVPDKYDIAAARSANSKIIHHFNIPKKEFYDLKIDPSEKQNLFKDGDAESIPGGEEHLLSLLNWLNLQRQIYGALPKTDAEGEVELSESMKEELKSLGYMQ